jgi:hypothetical protein
MTTILPAQLQMHHSCPGLRHLRRAHHTKHHPCDSPSCKKGPACSHPPTLCLSCRGSYKPSILSVQPTSRSPPALARQRKWMAVRPRTRTSVCCFFSLLWVSCGSGLRRPREHLRPTPPTTKPSPQRQKTVQHDSDSNDEQGWSGGTGE